MKSIQFLGAAGMVTGSSYIITGDRGDRLLVDLGMFQGTEEIHRHNLDPLPDDIGTVNAVILTHAHLDHCGRLPLIVKAGYEGKIYMTEPTYELLSIVLNDVVSISERDSEAQQLYTRDEVEKIMQMAEIVFYHKPFTVGDFQVEYYDAGHIMGSASVLITEQSTKKVLACSGDIGNFPETIVRPTEFIERADYVLMESTYGDRLHPVGDPREEIAKEIQAIEHTGGTLLIPAFSLERTQVLLHIIDHLKKSQVVRSDTAIFLDSPMGIRATDIYRKFSQFYNDEMQEHDRIDDPFDFPGLVVTAETGESKQIRTHAGPKVIIAGSGMMTGGRIMYHAADFLPKKNTHLLIVGYMSEETIGREIQEGAQDVEIRRVRIPVRAKVKEISTLSAHADQGQLMSWFRSIKGVEKLFLVHGETGPRQTLQELVGKQNAHISVQLPLLGETASFV